MSTTKIYFPNFNGLRFIAAFLVIIHHIEQIKFLFKLENYGDMPFFQINGKLGVVLFFVLSGFLITYLLLAEESVFQKISIKDFYIRRIIRIWPLYFLIVFLAFFVLPFINFFAIPGFEKQIVFDNLCAKLILFLIFFPNLASILYGTVPYASQTWSVGTEEQFYLIWPILLRYFKKNRLLIMFIIVVVYFFTCKYLDNEFFNFIPFHKTIKIFLTVFNVDCMAIGGFFAILLFNKSRFLNLLYYKLVYFTCLSSVIILIFLGIQIPIIHNQVYAVLFGIIILNLGSNHKLKTVLENQFFNYFGKISYGLYMYHSIGIVLAIAISVKFNLTSNFLIYTLSFLFTIGISSFSFRYFESYFLKFKNRFSKIAT